MAEQGRTEQIISQLQAKTLYAVLSSRIPAINRLSEHHPDPSTRTRRRDRWFNLALGELPPALLLEIPNCAMDPMVIDILLLSSSSSATDHNKAHVVERWSATCDPPPPPPDGSLYRKTYKKSIVLLRSLYSVLRLLPLFRIFRTLLCSSSSHSYNLDISYRVSSFSRQEEEKELLKTYTFTPVETQFGYLSLSVTYRPDLSGFNLEAASSSLAPPPPPMIITDYVGSPAAEPMRPFPPSPAAGYRNPGPISYPSRGHNSSERPHSWNAMPMEEHHHPLSEQISLPMDAYRNRTSSGQRTAAVSHKKGSFSFDEFRLSPPFSASPTPSPPPTYSSGSSLQSRLRSETAPVSIPMGLGLPGKGQAYRTPNHSDPTRSFLPPPSPRSTRMDHSSQESPSSEGRSFRKSEGLLKVADFYSNLHLYAAQKGLKDGRDDSGRFSGGFSSSGSPRFGFSRSSSRLSMQDDLDDCDFNCPFAVDDVDTSESQTRNLDGKEVPESSQAYTSSSHKSQDAAVGALVHMLKTAPPLRQDHSYSSHSSRSEVNCEVGNSSLFKLRKSSVALEELRSYRKIKDILLSQSRTELLNSVKRTTE